MKFLDDILIEETGSTPASPTGNTGIIFVSASGIHYRNAGVTTLGQTVGRVNVLYYTGSGDSSTTTYTWNKPNGCNFVRIFALGPGGGGGSGRCSTVGQTRTGGGGGGGGAIVWAQFAGVELPTSVTITVPGCSPGGTPVSTAATNGNPGSSATGSYTTFGTFVSASGGDGGFGGLTTGTTVVGRLGGLISTCRPYTILPYGGCPGGSVSNLGVGQNAVYSGVGTTGVFNPTRGISSTQLNNTSGGGAGGGAGGGVNSTTIVQTAGSGSGGTEYGVGKLSPGSPGIGNVTPNGSNGTDNFIDGYLQIMTGSLIELYAPGSGGHGGAWPSGSGGNGGQYGAGGGGGGAGPTLSGAGGSGSAGLLVVVEYL
jgi:hypothetical protein